MTKTYLRVEIKPGMFSSERAVSFTSLGKTYELLVDVMDLAGDLLLTRIVDENAAEALVDLPRETFSDGRRIRVMKKDLVVRAA